MGRLQRWRGGIRTAGAGDKAGSGCSTPLSQLGRIQIMGDNYKVCGFDCAEDFVQAMVSGAPAQLDAFVGFVKKNGLADEMVRRDWAGFARGYNGPAYKANKYDKKLDAAFKFHSAGGSHADSPLPTLRQGDEGEEVRKLQRALGIDDDGDFGPNTKKAVRAFQKKNGLYVDGVVGKNTWARLDAD